MKLLAHVRKKQLLDALEFIWWAYFNFLLRSYLLKDLRMHLSSPVGGWMPW